MQIQLEVIIDESVEKVFSTMLSLPVRHNPEFSGWNSPDHLVAGSVGFTGVFSGILYFCMELPFACSIASQMLGLPAAEIEKDGLLVDAIGELTNMIAGQLKSILCDRGMACSLTVPSVIQGSFTVRSRPDISRLTRSFSCDANLFQIELLIRQNAG
jgi:CheY-specific phosphatase CheX